MESLSYNTSLPYTPIYWPLFTAGSAGSAGKPWDVVAISSPPDGSCFFHSLLNAFWPSYRTESLRGESVTKRELVEGVRRGLATRLGQKDESGTLFYDKILGGNLAEFGLEEFNLATMQRTLEDPS